MGRENEIFNFIKDEIDLRGMPPTIREIGLRFKITSTNGVRYFLEKLESQGYIRRRTKTARGISLTGYEVGSRARKVPLLGRVPAGGPDYGEENLEDLIVVDERMAKGENVFAVRVNGDSMIGAGIHDGDIAVVKMNPHPQNGDIVIALIDDEVTLKRLHKTGEDTILKPENERYGDIDLSHLCGRNVSILGTLIAIVRTYR